MTYNEALKTARLKAGLTQKDVAEALQISQPMIVKMEKGTGSPPSINRLFQLADLYNTTLDNLLGRK